LATTFTRLREVELIRRQQQRERGDARRVAAVTRLPAADEIDARPGRAPPRANSGLGGRLDDLRLVDGLPVSTGALSRTIVSAIFEPGGVSASASATVGGRRPRS